MRQSMFIWVLGIGLVLALAGWIYGQRGVQQPVAVESGPAGDEDTTAEEVVAAASRMADFEDRLGRAEELAGENKQTLADIAAVLDDVRGAIELLGQSVDEGDVGLSATLDDLAGRIRSIEEGGALVIGDSVIPVGGGAISWTEPVRPPVQVAGLSDSALLGNPDPAADPDIRPALTLPPNTQIYTRALTALVGRLPVDGDVANPWRFKLVAEADNFTSQDFRVPGLSGVILGGQAWGELTLSCVRGTVDTITYVFADGTIHTHRTPTNSADLQDGIGWIGDEVGNPCVPGELKTNADEVIALSIASSGIAGIARGYAEAQTNNRTGEDGTTVRTVTGDIDDFALASAVADAASETDLWLRRRLDQSFDAIYAPSGVEVVVHIENTVLIDYDRSGRRLSHSQEIVAPQARFGGYD